MWRRRMDGYGDGVDGGGVCFGFVVRWNWFGRSKVVLS